MSEIKSESCLDCPKYIYKGDDEQCCRAARMRIGTDEPNQMVKVLRSVAKTKRTHFANGWNTCLGLTTMNRR